MTAQRVQVHWPAGDLRKMVESDDLHIAPFREDGITYGTPTWIWSVVVDGELYVRAYNGRDSRWYKSAMRERAGRIMAAGIISDVHFDPVDGTINGRIDDAYRAKYRGSPYLNAMIAQRAREATRRNLVKVGAGMAIGAAVSTRIWGDAHARTANGTAKTLILASHPYPDRSVVNKALWEVAQKAEDTLFRNLESVFGDNMRGFDRAAERRLYESMDRLVLMFPIHWFNLTPMLKAYMNEIWGSGAPPELRGKELLVVTTTAGDANAYTRDGRLGFSIEDVLTPLRASARYTGMTFSEPLAFLGAAGAGAQALRGYQNALAARLREQPRKS